MPGSGLRYLALRRRKQNYSKALNKAEKKQVSKIAKAVLNRNLEKKWKTSSWANQNITNSGHITGLLRPSQGDAYNEREGSVVTPTYLEVRAAIEQNNAATQRQSVRLCVVQSKMGETAPGLADFPGFLGNFTPDQLSKYNVLADHVITLNENGAAAPVRRQLDFKIYGKKFHKARWLSGTTAGVSPDDGGSVTLYVASDVAASPPTITSNHLIKYTDA